MRIMYIIKSFALKAGVERVMSDKMNYLVRHGYEVTMVTYEQGNHPYAFPLDNGVHHHNIDACFFKLGSLPLWKRPLERIRMRRRFRQGLQKIVDEEQPDIIVTTTYSMKLLDIILSIRSKAHRIIESHIACYTVRKAYDYRNSPVMKRVAAIYDKWAFHQIGKFEKLIVLTNGDAQEWSKYIKDVEIIPNPVTVYPESIQPHDGSGHRIIAVGRLHEQKGFDMLTDAFAMIAAKCPQWHIDIFGNGVDEQQLRILIHTHGLDGRINIMPPTSKIYEEYQQSEFFVLSSRYEGFPLVLNEAMSCGIPCVAFRCKYGPEDAISHGENGLLADNGNIEDLARQMLWMIEHKSERLAMGQKARLVAKRYHAENIMSRWELLFSRLLSVG